MNYIILDLEWDSAYSVIRKRFLNQILQIGAVKLDENFNIIDVFDVTVKSSFSKRLSKRFIELTGITKEKMLSGERFEDAVRQYNEWVGNDTVTMTWSDSDLYTIDENEEFILKDKVRFHIEKYLDLQRFIQGEMRLMGFELNNQISLGDAAEKIGISTEEYALHNAKDDSLVCAALLKKCYNKERFYSLIRDTANPDFYKRLKFKAYAISDIDDENIDKKQLEFCCDVCGKKAKRLTKWKYHNRWFSAVFACSCGRKFKGRLYFKQTYDSVITRRRICEMKPKKDEVQSVPETV